MACCLPLGFAAAAGVAGLSVVLEPLRPWMLGISGALLLLGFWQLYRRGAVCARRSRTAQAIFWISAALVLATILMPQAVATLLAGGNPLSKSGQPALSALAALKSEFNRARDEYRVIALFSPT